MFLKVGTIGRSRMWLFAFLTLRIWGTAQGKVYSLPHWGLSSVGCSDHLVQKWHPEWKSWKAPESDRPHRQLTGTAVTTWSRLKRPNRQESSLELDPFLIFPPFHSLSSFISLSALFLLFYISHSSLLLYFYHLVPYFSTLYTSTIFYSIYFPNLPYILYCSHVPRRRPAFMDSFMSSRWVPSSCNLNVEIERSRERSQCIS